MEFLDAWTMRLRRSNTPVPVVRLKKPEYVSDAIVSLLRELGVEYVAINPGATFRAIHDSLVNFVGNSRPEVVLCTHEETAVAMACGYARATGRLGVAIVHNIVGLQHATRAIYDAWLERVPVLVLGGTGPLDVSHRRPTIDWVHTAAVQGNLVREYVKWDDQPEGVEGALESLIRACRISVAEPEGPTYVCFDVDLQEAAVPKGFRLPDVNDYPATPPPQPNPDALKAAAKALVDAENPVILAEFYAKNQGDMNRLVELAETLSAPVVDLGGRFNFPNTHPLDLTGYRVELLRKSDVVFCLNSHDLYGAVNLEKSHFTREVEGLLPADASVIEAGMEFYNPGSWAQSYQRLAPLDLRLAGSSRITVPVLVSLCEKELSRQSNLKSELKERKAKLSDKHQELRKQWRTEADKHRGEKPIALSFLASEVWKAVKSRDWVLTFGTLNGWARKLWDWSRFYQYGGKGHGTGTGFGGALGVALAHKGSKRLCVALQADGDLLYTPSSLWTAAHHRIPMLVVMLNNRSYFNDERHQEHMAEVRGRPVENRVIGIRLEEPATDFAKLAESFSLHGEGPIEDPRDVAPALKRAVDVVEREKRLALVDTVTQPR
ncbi:MAG: thiamine pyrophosphate-binding protein [Thaumarchaeota archaeon]|nr:thiamine pyrophosphate-binding protein [Nitrososphaerota archaeon]